MRRSGHVARAYNVLVGRPERKKTLGGPRHRWDDNINMESGLGAWTGLIWLRTGTGGRYF